MAEIWLPWCERRNGPDWKQGYPGIVRRKVTAIKGEVKHSAEGSFAALLAALQHPSRQASWTFSISKTGHVVQHYPLESITWHCGDAQGNKDYVGEEHEGVVGEPLTVAQNLATTHLSLDIRRLAGISAPPAIRVNLWEHNWISSTSCPSDRISWVVIIAKIKQEEAEKEEEEDNMLLFIGKQGGGGGIFSLDGVYISANRWATIQREASAAGITIKVAKVSSSDDFFTKASVTYPYGN